MSAIRAAAPPGNAHRDRADEIWEMHRGEGVDSSLTRDQNERLGTVTYPLLGSVYALREEVRRGYMGSFETLVRAETFGDLLDMADYLQTEGYKDPAAVIAGGVLQEHLRELAKEHGISLVDRIDWKKSQQLNQDLAAAGVYPSTDQKSVAAWLGVRNDAAHGNFDEYKGGQVDLMLRGVPDFVGRTSHRT